MAHKNLIKKRMITIQALTEVLREYDSGFKENDAWLLISFLDIPLNGYSFVFQEFSKVYFLSLEKMQLRDSATLSFFFSSSPISISEYKMAGEQSSIPAGSGTPGDPKQIPKGLHKPFILQIKNNMKILNEEDAKDAFRQIAPNSGFSIPRRDFDLILKKSLPMATDKVRTEIAYIFDSNQTGSVTRESFVNVMVVENPEVQDRIGALFEKTSWAKAVFESIFEKLRAARRPLREVFESQESGMQKAVDVLRMRLKLPQPQETLMKMLTPFLVTVGGAKVINIEELQQIVDEHGERMAPVGETPLAHQSQQGGFSGLVGKNKKAELINSIREKIKSNQKYYLKKFNQQITDPDHPERTKPEKITYHEFRGFLALVDPDVTKKESKELFESLEIDFNDKLLVEDALIFFGLRGMLERGSSTMTMDQGNKNFDSIIADILKGLTKRKKTPDQIFDFKTGKIKRVDFEKLVKVIIGKDSHHENLEEFFTYLTPKTSKGVIDNGKFKLLLEEHLNRNTFNLGSHSETVDMFLFDLLFEMNDDVHAIVAAFDPDRDGEITFPEFYTRTRRLTSKQYPQNDIDKIFKELKAGDHHLSTATFRSRLVEVMLKFETETQYGNQSELFDPLESPRAKRPRKEYDFEESIDMRESMTAREGKGRGENSMPGFSLFEKKKENLSPEEERRRDIQTLYASVREKINYEDTTLFNRLREEDNRGENKLHPNYIVDILISMGPALKLTDNEIKMLFEGVSKDGEMVYYLDFVGKLFPTKQMAEIKTAKHLVEEIIKNMSISRTPLKAIWKQAKGSENATGMTEDSFKSFLASHGILLAKDTIRSIYKEFDEQKNYLVTEQEFYKQFHELKKVRTAKELIKLVRDHLAIMKTTTQEAFKPFEPINKLLPFNKFVDALESFKVDIMYIEMEIIFDDVDVDKSGTLSLEELHKKLDVPDAPPTKVVLDTKTTRMAMYRFMIMRGLNFDEFFQLVDSGKTYMTLKDFEIMIQTIGIDKMNLQKDIQPLFEAIDYAKDYSITKEELAAFYDESSILNLFPHVLEFKIHMLNEISRNSISSSVFIRKYVRDHPEGLDRKEFEALVKDLKPEIATPENIDLIFNELDTSKDGLIECAELRSWLNNGNIVDVVDLANRIRRILAVSKQQPVTAFKAVETNNTGYLLYPDFNRLLANHLTMRLGCIEIEELFAFASVENDMRVTLKEFLVLFDGLNVPNPFTHNKKYMDGLTESARKYYSQKYRFMIPKADGKGENVQDRFKGYSRERDKKIVNFSIGKEEGVQSAPAIGQNAFQGRLDQLTTYDNMFKNKVESALSNSYTIDRFFLSFTSEDKNSMGEHELGQMFGSIGMRLPQNQPEIKIKIFRNICGAAKDKFLLSDFKKYLDLVKMKFAKKEFDPRQQIPLLEKKMSDYMMQYGLSFNEVVSRFKGSAKEGLVFHEFHKMLVDISRDSPYTEEDSEEVFKYLTDGASVATMEAMKKKIFEDFERVQGEAMARKDEDIKRRAKVGFDHPDGTGCSAADPARAPLQLLGKRPQQHLPGGHEGFQAVLKWVQSPRRPRTHQPDVRGVLCRVWED